MDPISAFAALSSFIAVAGALRKVYKVLRDYSKDMAHASAEIYRLAEEVFDFKRLLIFLQNTLENLPEKIVESIASFNIEKHQISNANDIVREF